MRNGQAGSFGEFFKGNITMDIFPHEFYALYNAILFGMLSL
jgi:hypothetical protein